jgi:hypothetical protein
MDPAPLAAGSLSRHEFEENAVALPPGGARPACLGFNPVPYAVEDPQRVEMRSKSLAGLGAGGERFQIFSGFRVQFISRKERVIEELLWFCG